MTISNGKDTVSSTRDELQNYFKRFREVGQRAAVKSDGELLQLLSHEFGAAHRRGYPLSALVLDLDNLSRYVNGAERMGHLGVYKLIDHYRRGVEEHMISSESISKFGGDEVLILGRYGPREARTRAESFRSGIETMHQKGKTKYPLTASIGIATYPGSSISSGEDLFEMADIALEEAKRTGKNRIFHISDLNDMNDTRSMVV